MNYTKDLCSSLCAQRWSYTHHTLVQSQISDSLCAHSHSHRVLELPSALQVCLNCRRKMLSTPVITERFTLVFYRFHGSAGMCMCLLVPRVCAIQQDTSHNSNFVGNTEYFFQQNYLIACFCHCLSHTGYCSQKIQTAFKFQYLLASPDFFFFKEEWEEGMCSSPTTILHNSSLILALVWTQSQRGLCDSFPGNATSDFGNMNLCLPVSRIVSLEMVVD